MSVDSLYVARFEAVPSLTRRASRLVVSVVSTVFTTLAVVVASVALVVSVATHMSASDEFSLFGHPALTVLSGSMTPTIRTGDFIIDEPVTRSGAAHLHVGQVITYRDNGRTLTHRIVEVTSTPAGGVGYITKGDANNLVSDHPIAPGAVVGVYRWKLPYGGYVLHALHRPIALVLLLASPLLWLLSGVFKAMARELDEEDHDPALAGEREVGSG